MESYDIVKKVKGGLALDLPAFDSSVQNMLVEIPHNVQKKRVNRVHALGIFTDGTLERMYREGYFTVEPVAAFEEDVASVFYPIEDKVVLPTDEELLLMLIKGNRKAVRTLIEEKGAAARQQVVLTAQEHIDDIPTSMISDLEKILGTELIIEAGVDGDEE